MTDDSTETIQSLREEIERLREVNWSVKHEAKVWMDRHMQIAEENAKLRDRIAFDTFIYDEAHSAAVRARADANLLHDENRMLRKEIAELRLRLN